MSIDPTLFEGRYWLVIYDRKGAFPAPGGKHIVRVDIRAGDATFPEGTIKTAGHDARRLQSLPVRSDQRIT